MSTTIQTQAIRRRLIGTEGWLYAAKTSGVPQQGLVTSSGVQITGLGTLFASGVTPLFAPGDTIVAGNQAIVIASVNTDTSLTLVQSPQPGWTNQPFAKSINYDDAYIASTVVPAAVRRFEREAGFHVNQKQIVVFPDGLYAPAMTTGQGGAMGGSGGLLPAGYPLPEGTPYINEPAYTWWRNQFDEYGRVTLKQRPIWQVQRYRVLWNGGANIYTVPFQWIHWDFQAGEAWLIPYSGAAILGPAVVALQILQAAFSSAAAVPGVLAVDYVVGLDAAWQNDPQWTDLERCLEEWCAYCVLSDIDEAFDAGAKGSQAAVAGWSQSLDWDRFDHKKGQLQGSIERFKDSLKQDQGGILLGSG